MAVLTRNWWLVGLRGLLAIIFGLLAFIWPGLTLFALVLLFGAYALVDGIFAVGAAISRHAGGRHWWAVLIEGLAGILFGLLTFFWPGMTALILLYLIAFWGIVTGILEIAAAVRLRREISNEWMLGLGGVLSLLFGVLLILFPGAGALAVVWLIGSYAIVFGITLLILAWQLRTWGSRPGTNTQAPAAL